MSEMIDRVAKAIADGFATKLTTYYHPFQSVLSPEAAEALARLAIEAMREPTEYMVKETGPSWGSGHKDDYQAMIDAALNETST